MTEGSFEPASGECITGITSMATRHVLVELAAAFERQSGQRATVEAVGGVDAARRVEAGEAFDFVVLARQAIDKLADVGRIDPETRTDLARSPVAIAITKGARCPEIDSEEAVRDAVLAARSIGYSTGPSGRHIARLFERWGITDIIAPRVVIPPPGVAVGSLVARGELEIGLQQLSELVHVPGIDVVGMLPPAIQEITVFAGAVCFSSARRAAAKALLSFCASPKADAVKRAHGMEP